MIRVLHILSTLHVGGVENLLLNYYKAMDREKYHFDFIVHGEKKGAIEPFFEKMNSKVFHIPPKHESFFRNLKSMRDIIKNGNYSVVHVHQGVMSVFPLFFAKKSGVSIRIAHSHIAFKEESIFSKLINKFLILFLKKFSTHWFACGIDAGKSLWGKDAVQQGKVYIMKNAIDIEKFKFNKKIRNEIREELGIEGKFVIGHIGRFTYQKNHEFLIRIFKEVYDKKKNTVLLLIGKGELEDDVKRQIQDLGLTEEVKFLGFRSDVSSLYQAMDIFILPSRYEGLPVVLVETQSAGIKSIVSDTITKEVQFTNLIDYISLQKLPKFWANKVLNNYGEYERKNISQEIINSGYDIKKEAKKLELIYASYENKN
jgi:glycosyltransferase involved in cell wall biosynthesis